MPLFFKAMNAIVAREKRKVNKDVLATGTQFASQLRVLGFYIDAKLVEGMVERVRSESHANGR